MTSIYPRLRLMERPARALDHEVKTLMLCLEDGTPLPGQKKVVIEQEVGELTYITVTFAVDGREVSAGSSFHDA